MLRVLGGIAKGRKLATPTHASTRPTAVRARTVLFDTLAGNREFAAWQPPDVFIDVGAGSGAVGIEALSRYPETKAIFIERAADAVACIKSNAKQCGFENRTQVWRKDVCLAGINYAPPARANLWLFLDPPYAHDVAPWLAVVRSLSARQNTLTIVQTKRELPDIPDMQALVRKKTSTAHFAFLAFSADNKSVDFFE